MNTKNDPHGPCRGRTGRNAVHHDCSVSHHRKQPTRRETRKAAIPRYRCAFCGQRKPEADLIGRDGSLLFCVPCAAALDALRDGADDALTILRGSRQC